MVKKAKGNSVRAQPILRGSSRLERPENRHQPDARRKIVAALCRTIGTTIRGDTIPTPPAMPSLSPRMRQTLLRLLAGDSEKQIASLLGVSRHTIHVYVKALYKAFDVGSRGELLAQFVRPPALIPPIQSSTYTSARPRRC